MPYAIVEQDSEFCVFKVNPDDSPIGESLGCHTNRADAQQQITAILISEASKGLFSYLVNKGKPGERLMFLITSNGYLDRDGEHVKVAALIEHVAKQWRGEPGVGEFVGKNTLLYRHHGEPIGDIVWADMIGPFLVEVAKKRDTSYARIKWSYIEKIQSANEFYWGVSHGFNFKNDDRVGGVYDHIYKFETSVLPLHRAANGVTLAVII